MSPSNIPPLRTRKSTHIDGTSRTSGAAQYGTTVLGQALEND
jgi:hypothetical protein